MSRCNKTLFVLASAIILLTGCGKQHDAETVVKDFIEQNVSVKDYEVEFRSLDSTTHVSDSLIEKIKFAAVQDKLFKKDIKYGADPKTGKYVFLPANIYVGKDTLRRTFYLDMKITNVVAFK